MKSPDELAGEVMDAHYGDDSDWAEANQYGESGFTLAQVESDIDSSEIMELIAEGIRLDRAEHKALLDEAAAVLSTYDESIISLDGTLTSSALAEIQAAGPIAEFLRRVIEDLR
jgi:hypothetical protein